MEDVPAPQLVWDLATSHAVARCIHVVADLGVADALDDNPATAGSSPLERVPTLMH